MQTGCNFIKTQKEYIYLRDTIKVAMNNDMLEEVYTGARVTKTIVFTDEGQSTTFKEGEPVELIFDGLDMSKYSLDIKHNRSTGEITFSVVDNEDTKVILTEKCEVVERRNTSYLPMIEVAEDLNPEQIIITPIFDNDCNQLGYQIRYGSEERGCRKVALPVLKRFSDCANKFDRKKRINSKKKESPVEINKNDCPEWLLFGVPCK
jgi:hypothetical protein